MHEFKTRHPFLTDLMVFTAGALLPLAFAPFNFWPLAILLPVVLLWSWDGAAPRRAARRGGLFGLGAYGFGIYWIFISLHDYGHAPAPFAALATFAVVLLMALYLAALGGLVNRWGPPPGPVRGLLVIPALWTLLDWVRSWLFTGFPWLALGYSQTDSPLGNLAPCLGVFGVGWAVLLSAGLLQTVLHSVNGRERLGWAGLLAMLWIGAWGLGQIVWVTPAGTPLRVALVQGNIAQDQKWQPNALDETLSRYVQLSLPEHGRSDVIIWPETAIPAFLEEVRPFVAALAGEAKKAQVDYITGIPTGSWETGIFHNSIIGIGRSPGLYHKRRLLVFGEYLPLRPLFLFFRHWVDIPMADFTAGEREQPLFRAGGQPVGLSICFEAVFGSEIRRALPDATWLINISNDAWFKDSLAPHQHLQIARMRALEVGRYMARATNTGVSAIIDERGRIRMRGPQFEAEVIRGEVQPLQGLTPYARFGDWPTVSLMLGLLGLGWFNIRRLITSTLLDLSF
ncbi:apolipoprotein N-acyltransferase [Candidatus Contendibacter odensensis]|uniref:Apolipoprotein N-acyltransferase n=1 Tax=Candidatus Contendobacter odensis Run_B_J11 TaxID=1400861 RepID=A0A7U7J5E0_9GAMM|nr:apolipoprotein N-acyltransferase [Candidatus Contendobacter odensis]CDH46672.1 putative Apolipoprotein N-acyltransferase [Candidatus Contendobacter odensis Run_B_J11]